MKKQLFPKEIVENTVEVHQFIYSKRSQAIYIALLVLIVGALLSLPFIKVNIYTSVRGIIKPSQERITLRITQTGQVISTLLFPNTLVAKGDTLLPFEIIPPHFPLHPLLHLPVLVFLTSE